MPKMLSTQCKDLIHKMIEIDPSKRISARDAMNHPWIKEAEEFHRAHTT